MKKYDVIIVGCGLSGATVARQLADAGKNVLILERRNHIGGNLFDYKDPHGIRVHKYGPHTFHTNEKYLYDYICRYASWTEYKLRCGAEINGICVPTPFNYKTIDTFFDEKRGELIKEHIKNTFAERTSATVVEALNCGDKVVTDYAQFLFDNDYSLYTAKQWGVPANQIDPCVLNRVPLRFNYEEGYFEDTYQVMPEKSYTSFFEELLNSERITVQLEIDAHSILKVIPGKSGSILFQGEECSIPVVYTGALDELFDHVYGELPYRSLRFEWKHEYIESFQSMPVVAYPQAEGYTRIVEYKKLPLQDVKGTTYEVEYPLPYQSGQKQEPYYPVLTVESQERYSAYQELAQTVENLFLCGRLADFNYYNMDQALERALKTADQILGKLG